MILLFLLTALLSLPNTFPETVPNNPSPVLSFPGAEGFGKFTTGGRGGKVIYVTNLNDSGPGSLREAVTARGARYVLFTVSGTIELKSPLEIKNGDVTIAGQTAPGDGICISHYNVSIKCDNVVIRYLRFRMGDAHGQQDDALTCLRRENIIIDHCSISWATDECGSFYDNTNFTLQWSIVSESLNHSVHAKGDHGYGGIWGGKQATFHHNLLAHHKSRLPRFCGSRYHKEFDREIVEFANNVIYNWMDNSSYGGERGNHSIINNYYKPGPATAGARRERILEPYSPFGRFYVSGNVLHGSEEISSDNWKGVKCEHPDSVKMSVPVTGGSSWPSAVSSFNVVIEKAGASLHRDAVDQRLCVEVKKGIVTFGKNGIIDSQQDVGGWPLLKSAPVPVDTDQDGMPDFWEVSRKLNPNDLADGSGYAPNEHYPNLELYLNSLVE